MTLSTSPALKAAANRPARSRSAAEPVALLTDDAWLAMPPASHEYVGSAAIAGFLRTSTEWRGRRRLKLVLTWANGQPAFGCYLGRQDEPTADPTGVLVLTMSGDKISTITRFLDNDLHRQFGLADEIPAGQDRQEAVAPSRQMRGTSGTSPR